MSEKFKDRLILWATLTGMSFIPGILLILLGLDNAYKYFIIIPLVWGIPILLFGKIPRSGQSVDDFFNQDETDAFDKALGLGQKKKNTAKQQPKSNLKQPHNYHKL